MPGRARQALATVMLLWGHSANAPGRGDQAVRSRQARGPQAVLGLGALLGACAGYPLSATQSSGIRSAQVVLPVRESPLRGDCHSPSWLRA